MFEASKTRRVRDPSFYNRFLSGSVLDIGCGSDPVVPNARPFDLAQGDANRITDFIPAVTTFDCVHSSHCLEHMRDVPGALGRWWSLVRPGGHLIIVVPHEDLYEQGTWPSIFNSDHKATFRVGSDRSWSPVSYNLEELLRQLPGAEIVEITIQDHGYDYCSMRFGLSRTGRAVRLANRTRRRLVRTIGIETPRIARWFERLEHKSGVPIDQTLGGALAQIQAVARKRL